ncbi:hypothetical protein GCM10018962_43150 [Dactylosporangium matsuzakiense]|uniref:Uncharacterized protein n=1 Tax=Dactylosporangium matsuzakiense TaxID=53360 RepID=A0A9W6KD20_9ACTN|nr:hypothetical protein GCM10017581_016070 [Dactylosporangium matsuzakiense]
MDDGSRPTTPSRLEKIAATAANETPNSTKPKDSTDPIADPPQRPDRSAGP